MIMIQLQLSQLKKFLCNPNVKRSIRDQKLLFKKKTKSICHGNLFLSQLVFFFDRIDNYLIDYKHKLIYRCI